MREGEVFAGYTIDRQLGRGGMGAVYLARHPRLPRRIALKLLNEELFSDKELRARFEREADLVAQLDHPNIVTVYDRGADDGRLWISMHYVDGVDAATVDPRTLPPTRAVQIVAETAKALDFAHSRGVLHRDVKPANILLANGGNGQERVFLTDFGIARIAGEANRLTQTGTFTATLAYASPEQLTGADMDGRSDQYSLACTLYWLLTGSAPYESTHPATVIQGHLQRQPPPVSTARAGLPPALDAVLARAMAKRPADRFASCSEFAEAARRALAGESPHRSAPHIPYPSAPNASAAPGPAPHASAPSIPGTPAIGPGHPSFPQHIHGHPPQQSPIPPGAFAYPPMRPRRRSYVGLWIGLSMMLIIAVVAGIGTWVAIANRDTTPPQRDIEEMRLAFPNLLPPGEVPAGQTWAQGRGFGDMGCSATVMNDRSRLHWTFIHGAAPDMGKPTAYWDCYYAGSYMIPEDIIRWPQMRVFRYKSASEVQQVIQGLGASPVEQDLNNNGRQYSNVKAGSEPTSSPRIATIFPNDPKRENLLIYSYGLGASNDPSMDQLLDWWRKLPID
ncbi:serine/threonine-protein kinase [Nocardia cyriacigeorgica]|uniref:serine/threonine-protein kinase n=1 Tax=Nocardia cyriacigeorgica TaxID=135487 RepID=UPI0018954AB5|nr:serine/threonine-protein kinase [Nocardia cyriacigeorgica]MBF6416676.1 protein kinase [Nocardia cyriacigeorgica]